MLIFGVRRHWPCAELIEPPVKWKGISGVSIVDSKISTGQGMNRGNEKEQK
jgi:hypothetical protein